MSEGLAYYRCLLCGRRLSPWDIEEHGECPSCGHTRVKPTNLKRWEMLVEICKRPLTFFRLWRDDRAVHADN